MSHFTVLVVGDDVQDALEPFCENTDYLPKEYQEFEDAEAENRAEYASKTITMVHLPDGKLAHQFDERFKKRGASVLDYTYEYPEGAKKVDVNFFVVYPTFEEYMTKYVGSQLDPEKNRYGYWHNPKAKWDWYQEGGRWKDTLVTKDGKKCDSCLFSDLDLEATYGPEGEPFTFAILKDGEWIEEGNMGWWGIVSDRKEADEWKKKYKELVESIDPESTVTVVDCHI